MDVKKYKERLTTKYEPKVDKDGERKKQVEEMTTIAQIVKEEIITTKKNIKDLCKNRLRFILKWLSMQNLIM